MHVMNLHLSVPKIFTTTTMRPPTRTIPRLFLRTPQCRSLSTTPALLNQQTFDTKPNGSTTSSESTTTSTTPKPPSTLDPAELSHFTTLASTWWAPHGSSRLLHLMNPLRLQFLSTLPIATSLPSRAYWRPSGPSPATTPGTTYLDVGCGGGILSESLARLPHTRSVLGLEPTPAVFHIAETHRRTDPLFKPSTHKLRYLNMSVEDFSAAPPTSIGLASNADKLVDVVTLMEVLEHTPTPSRLLGTLFPLVKPGGWLVLSTISRTLTSYLTTKLVAEDLLRIVPRGTHDWGKYLRPEEVVAMVRALGERGEVRCRGCMFVPGLGWRWVGAEKRVAEGEEGGVGTGGEGWGNYFIAVRKAGGEGEEGEAGRE